MTIAASSIIRRCTDTLNDTTSVAWPAAELVRYLNDGQREIVLHRPDALPKNSVFTLVAGAKQSLPPDGSKLIDIPNNAGGSKRAIRFLPNRRVLDDWTPGWQGLAGVSEILHYVYDPRDPRTFYVYPPAAAGVQVNGVYAAYPADLAEPAEGSKWMDVVGNISLPDIYANALIDYILYRAYTKDNGYANNAARATAYYAAFANALGIEIRATVAVGPQAAPGNPSVSSAAAGNSAAG